jgi:predicted nucleotidyltransferase
VKNRAIKIRDRLVNTKDLQIAIESYSEISAAYLFGSAAGGGVVNDLDIQRL